MALQKFVDEVGTDLNKYKVVKEEDGSSYYVKLLRASNITINGTLLNAENLNPIIDAINNLKFSKSGNTLTIKNQDGETITYTPSFNDVNTTYQLIKSGATLTLVGSDNTQSSQTLTKSDLGLSNVDNTRDSNKTVNKANQLTTSRVFQVSDYSNNNSSTSVYFNGTANVNIKLTSIFSFTNLYIRNESNQNEYAQFRFSNSNKRLEISCNKIIFLSNGQYANVPNNKSGTLVLDVDLNEINQRLDNLGFKEGAFTITSSGGTQLKIFNNTIKKCGKFCIGNASITNSRGGLLNPQPSIKYPDWAKPQSSSSTLKANIKILLITSLGDYIEATAKFVSGTLVIQSYPENIKRIEIMNAGWDLRE